MKNTLGLVFLVRMNRELQTSKTCVILKKRYYPTISAPSQFYMRSILLETRPFPFRCWYETANT